MAETPVLRLRGKSAMRHIAVRVDTLHLQQQDKGTETRAVLNVRRKHVVHAKRGYGSVTHILSALGTRGMLEQVLVL